MFREKHLFSEKVALFCHRIVPTERLFTRTPRICRCQWKFIEILLETGKKILFLSGRAHIASTINGGTKKQFSALKILATDHRVALFKPAIMPAA